MKAVKTIAALIFVTALGIVLVQPVLSAGDDAPPAAGRTPDRGEGAGGKREDEADPGDAPETAGDDFVTMRGLPKRCLREGPASPTGVVAARRGSRVLAGFPAQAPLVTYEVEGDAAWSPSGHYLAERGGRVYDASGTRRGTLFFRPSEWQWSPIADCAVAVTEEGTLTYAIPQTNRVGIRMLTQPVSDFEFSPNGRRLALVLEGDVEGLWVADLDGGAMTEVVGHDVHLMGWFSNRSVVFTKSKTSGLIRYSSGPRGPRVVPNAYAGGTLVRCPGRTFVVSLSSEATPALAELVARGGRIRQRALPAPIKYAGFSDVACSPDGGFLAASAMKRSGEKAPLVLLESSGTFIRTLSPGRTANPEWSTDGLVFVKFGRAGRGRLWFVPPGGAPRPTAYRVGGPGQYDWHVED